MRLPSLRQISDGTLTTRKKELTAKKGETRFRLPCKTGFASHSKKRVDKRNGGSKMRLP
jgi:hypothetical protein